MMMRPSRKRTVKTRPSRSKNQKRSPRKKKKNQKRRCKLRHPMNSKIIPTMESTLILCQSQWIPTCMASTQDGTLCLTWCHMDTTQGLIDFNITYCLYILADATKNFTIILNTNHPQLSSRRKINSKFYPSWRNWQWPLAKLWRDL